MNRTVKISISVLVVVVLILLYLSNTTTSTNTTTTPTTGTTTTTTPTTGTTTTLSPNITLAVSLKDNNGNVFYAWNSNSNADVWASTNGDNNGLVLVASSGSPMQFTYVGGQFITLSGSGGKPLYIRVDSNTGILYFAPTSSDTFTWTKGSQITHKQSGQTVMYAKNRNLQIGSENYFPGAFSCLCLSGTANQLNNTVPIFSY